MEGCVATFGSRKDSPLLAGKTTSRSFKIIRRYKSSRKCISSKSALLILIWSFVLSLWYGVALNPDLYLRIFVIPYSLNAYGITAFLMLFFPLAGFVADIKCGRYKTVIRSLCCMMVSIPFVIGALIAISLYAFLSRSEQEYLIASSISYVIGGAVLILSYVGLAAFTANVVQFGMDQLHDSPGEDRTIFIYWYVCIYFFSIFLAWLAWTLGLQLPYNFTIFRYYNVIGFSLLGLISLAVVLVLPVTLCVARHRKRWFLIEPGSHNPYKLVYRVTKFARQHKVPVRRSAFTYCEDEVPTGLDLAKDKYGGPFTTEEVENVKVFYGILKVLFCFGSYFFLDFAANSIMPLYGLHITPVVGQRDWFEDLYSGSLLQHIFFNCGVLSPLLVSVFIAAYLCLLRPFLAPYIPTILKRMGLGMLLVVLSLIASLCMDLAVHIENGNTTICMFDSSLFVDPPSESFAQSSFYLVIPLVLSALSNTLVYTAMFEFICSQSPEPMKGLLIGLLYAIRGVYQGIATALTIPFAVNHVSPSCGFYYYLFHVILGFLALLVYVCVAKRYRKRERDEPYNIHRYAEEYYSNPHQEQQL